MGQPKTGLGRGLGALIPRAESGLLEVEVARIAPNPQQPRLVIDEAGLAELAESIRTHGVLQPLIVSRAEAGYVLIAGERRWRAAQLAGLQTVPVLVKEATSRQRLELALVENLQRQDLNPLEAAGAYRQLIEEHGLTQEEVAARVGLDRSTVANALRLLRLPPEARDALARGAISEGHARAVLACREASAQLVVLRACLEQGLSVRQAEELARRLNGAEPARPPAPARALDPDLAALEERFRQALGTRVQLQRGRKGGRLVIHFFSDEELEGLVQAICRD